MKCLIMALATFLAIKVQSQSEKVKLEQRLIIITLEVSVLKKSTNFYEKIFEWEKSESSNEYISFFIRNGIQLAHYGKDELAEDATVDPNGSGF